MDAADSSDDRACDDFEEAWRAGAAPRIEDFLEEESDSSGAGRFRDLLGIELELSDEKSGGRGPADYAARFPGRVNDVAVVFFERERSAGRRPSIEEYVALQPSEAEREPLIRELMRIETGRLRDEYLGRFPGFEATVAEAFRPDGGGRRFRKLREHGRGGLGVVWLGHDEEVDRRVAYKEMRPPHGFDPDAQARFRREIEITARLDHPGVVPVFGIGVDPESGLFYASRFIAGLTLKETIERHRAEFGGRRDGAAVLSLRKLIGVLVDVCQVVDYAHARGVLHRDLKPSNIMVGRYGETLVIDWGLARTADDLPASREASSETAASDPFEERTLSLSPASREAATRIGSAVGTPSFMSPEQAVGGMEQLTPASDVYSLGATLYAILTGVAPFTQRTTEEILAKVSRGEFPRPRSLDPEIDRALEAICLKAMAREPGERYPSAHALAEELERRLADEPVIAYREPITKRSWRFLRRHRTVASTIAGILICCAIGLVWWTLAAREVAEDARVLLAEARQQAMIRRGSARRGDLEQAELGLKSAIASVAAVQGRLERIGPLGRSLRDRAADELAEYEARLRETRLLIDLDEARLAGARIKDGALDLAQEKNGFAAAFRRFGANLGLSDPIFPLDPEARDRFAGLLRSVHDEVREPVAFAVLEWALLEVNASTHAQIMEFARQVLRRDDLRPVLDAIAASEPGALVAWSRRDPAPFDDPSLLRAVGRALILTRNESEAVRFLDAARRAHPDDFWLNFDLAIACLRVRPQRLEESRRYFTAAEALRPQATGVLGNLALIELALGDTDRGKERLAEVALADPALALPHLELGKAALRSLRLRTAEAEFNMARKLDPLPIEALTLLGWTRIPLGKIRQADLAFERAIGIEPWSAPMDTELHVEPGDPPIDAEGRAFIERALASGQRRMIERAKVWAFAGRAAALTADGRAMEGIAWGWRAIEARSDFVPAHAVLGVILVSKGSPAIAVIGIHAAKSALERIRRVLEAGASDFEFKSTE
ncbi:MAG: protein kinase [Isosphaeraceae bacterium]|nr:protein kinase [Isosphaeraceae bacterium]